MANRWQQLDGTSWIDFSVEESAYLESNFLAGKKVVPFQEKLSANFVAFKLLPFFYGDAKAFRRVDPNGQVLNSAAASSNAHASVPMDSGDDEDGEEEADEDNDEEGGDDDGEEVDEEREEVHQWWTENHPHLGRPMWKPVTSKDVDGAADASKFCGSPFISAQYPWPKCGACNQPLQFLAQLATWTLPNAPAFGDGLIQVFYCTSCDDYKSFSQAQCMRLIPRAHVDLAQAITPAAGEAPANRLGPAQTVTSWKKEKNDFPNYEEAEDLGLDAEALPELVETIGPSPGDKIGGYPDWIQGMEYPNCPQCSQRMTLVLQIDSEDHVPHMWGDVGCAHLTQCPAHKDVLSLTWACH